MRLFDIHSDGKFGEYVQTPFQVNHEEAVLEGWLESNPDGIVEDGKILIVGRQVVTNFGGFIDLVGIDRQGTLVVVELKRNRTPPDTLAQALEYAAFAARLDTGQLEAILRSYLSDESSNLAEHHRAYFELGSDEAVSFNKDQRVVIVGQRVTPEIRQTASFLRSKGIRVTCVEFTFFQGDGGTRLLSQEIVVGNEADKPAQVASGFLPTATESGFTASLDDNGKSVFSGILALAKDRSMPIHWGTKGFSLNVNLGGNHVAVCYGYPKDSVYKQSVYTAMAGPGSITNKTAAPEEVVKVLRAKAQSTGLFSPAGRELKCPINRSFTESEVSALLAWIEAVEEAIRKYGPKE
ncbi:MAG: hypothetical protein ABSC19_04870 [Syntrophorhabdales bacterium]|jgi:hypothetical protein